MILANLPPSKNKIKDYITKKKKKKRIAYQGKSDMLEPNDLRFKPFRVKEKIRDDI